MKLEGYTPKQILINLTDKPIKGETKPKGEADMMRIMGYNHVTIQVDQDTKFKRIEDAYYFGCVAQVASLRFTSEYLGCAFGVVTK